MKTVLPLFAILLSSVFILSCNKKVPCVDETMLGDISYTDLSLASIQTYLNKTGVVYKDSLDQEIEFIIMDYGDTTKPHLFVGNCESNPGQMISFEYTSTFRMIELRNDSLGSFFIHIDTPIAFDSYELHDKLRVDNQLSSPDGSRSLDMLIDRRNVSIWQAEEINKYVVEEDESIILNVSFSNTFRMKDTWLSYPHKVFYNYANGIISFSDASGKNWVFDGFE